MLRLWTAHIPNTANPRSTYCNPRKRTDSTELGIFIDYQRNSNYETQGVRFVDMSKR